MDSVYVHGASKGLPPREEALAALDGRFRKVEAMPNMGLLKKVIADHIEGLYEEHGSSDSQNRIESVNTLATIPTVANRLMELVSDPSVSVTGDQPIRLGRSRCSRRKPSGWSALPFTVFPARIASVNQAVLLLGLNVVKGLLYRRHGFRSHAEDHDRSVGAFPRVRHPFAAHSEEERVERAGGDVRLRGLVHDIGKVILALQFPSEYEQVMNEAREKGVTVYEVENEYFSTTHATVGAWIADSGVSQDVSST